MERGASCPTISLITRPVITISGCWPNRESGNGSGIYSGLNTEQNPTAATLDIQSIRTASQSGLPVYDAGKKITGRKRHVLEDTTGNLMAMEITTTNVQDRDGARMLMDTIETGYGWLKKIWADGGYAGSLGSDPAFFYRNMKTKRLGDWMEWISAQFEPDAGKATISSLIAEWTKVDYQGVSLLGQEGGSRSHT